MNKQQVKELLAKHQTGALSDEEKAALDTWYINESKKSKPKLTENEISTISQRLKSQLPLSYSTNQPRRLWQRIAAASILLLGSSLLYVLLVDKKENIDPKNLIAENQITPAKNSATLLLSNGQKIVLSDQQTGHLTDQLGVTISKTQDGKLIYSVNPFQGEQFALIAYNTLSTSKAEQYQLLLPDSSRVWLNAASSLTFPTRFKGNSRTVELTGEAYFEVAHHKNVPFRVITKEQEIEVLGTHFNVNSYDNENSVKTTLLEGKVKVNPRGLTPAVVLKPGEQAKLTAEQLNISQVDVAHATAWKDGLFRFNGEGNFPGGMI